MPVCPTCEATLDEGARFCPHDGTPIAPEGAAPAAEAPAFANRVIDGRYRILRPIGAGGFGSVWLAEHVQIHKQVALKLMSGELSKSEEFRKRFEHEARAASRLSHVGCVSVIDFGHVARVEPEAGPGGDELYGAPYLVMEYVRGETLADRLARGPMDPAEAILIVRGVLAALRHAHGLGLVHRDLKPHNIMLCTGDGTTPLVKLLDFGLAKQIEGSPATQPMTQFGQMVGTPAYVSPEQAVGDATDARSDIYSLGVVLFEMVCGKTPFAGRDAESTMRAHVTVDPPRPRDLNPAISPELESVILKALAKEAGARHASAEEMQSALAACPEVSGRFSSGRFPSATSGRGRSRLPLYLAGGAAVLLFAVAGIVFALRRHAPAPAATTAPPAVHAPAVAPARPAAAPPPAAPSDRAQHALALVERGKEDEAIVVARAALAKNSHDGMARYALGAAYQSKFWCSDAIEEFEKAVKEIPALRTEAGLIRRAIACLESRAQYKAARFLATLGEPAVVQLKAAAAGDPDPEVRKGAQRALSRMKK